MKKIFSLFAALTLSAGLWAQTAGTTILVHNLTGWDNLYLYMWGDGGNDLGGGWPGFKAQREDKGDLIFLVAEGEYDGKSESLIFNNGNGAQLADYSITLGDSYELWVTLDGVYNVAPTALPTLFGDGVKGNKFMHNGQLIIRKGDKLYNALGAEL